MHELVWIFHSVRPWGLCNIRVVDPQPLNGLLNPLFQRIGRLTESIKNRFHGRIVTCSHAFEPGAGYREFDMNIGEHVSGECEKPEQKPGDYLRLCAG